MFRKNKTSDVSPQLFLLTVRFLCILFSFVYFFSFVLFLLYFHLAIGERWNCASIRAPRAPRMGMNESSRGCTERCGREEGRGTGGRYRKGKRQKVVVLGEWKGIGRDTAIHRVRTRALQYLSNNFNEIPGLVMLYREKLGNDAHLACYEFQSSMRMTRPHRGLRAPDT